MGGRRRKSSLHAPPSCSVRSFNRQREQLLPVLVIVGRGVPRCNRPPQTSRPRTGVVDRTLGGGVRLPQYAVDQDGGSGRPRIRCLSDASRIGPPPLAAPADLAEFHHIGGQLLVYQSESKPCWCQLLVMVRSPPRSWTRLPFAARAARGIRWRSPVPLTFIRPPTALVVPTM